MTARSIPTLVLLVMAAVAAAQDETATEEIAVSEVVASFEKTHRAFSVELQDAADAEARIALHRAVSEKLNALVKPHLGRDGIEPLIEAMEGAMLVDLEEAFLAVIDGHRDPSLRARGLLGLARHFGNNRRRKLCVGTLAFLEKNYGRLLHDGRTYAVIAEHETFYFENLAVGCKAPAIVSEDADGEVFRLSDYAGKVVVLRFWGDWCPACRDMYPYEREIVKRYKSAPFALIGVNSDPPERLRSAQRKKNLTWRSFSDGPTTSGPIATLYHVESWPTIVVIDGEGTIRYRSRGFSRKRMDEVLGKLIAEARSATAQAEGK